MLYYGEITAGSGLLLGGVRKHTSIDFQIRQHVEDWLDQAVQANQEANRDVASCTIIVCYKVPDVERWVKRRENYPKPLDSTL